MFSSSFGAATCEIKLGARGVGKSRENWNFFSYLPLSRKHLICVSRPRHQRRPPTNIVKRFFGLTSTYLLFKLLDEIWALFELTLVPFLRLVHTMLQICRKLH